MGYLLIVRRMFSTAIAALLLVASPGFAQVKGGESLIVNKFQQLRFADLINTAYDDLVREIQAKLPGVRPNPQGPASMTPNDLENLSAGKLQMMLTSGAFYINTEYAFLLLSSPPFLAVDDFLAWRKSPEGQELADAVYAKHGVKSLPCVAIDANMDFVTRRPLGDEYMLKGARIGMTAPFGNLYAATGMSFAALPFSELRNAMEKGVIDGAYAWTPHESIELQLYEATQALYTPSVIRRFFVVDLLVGLRFWNELPESSRKTIAATCNRLTNETLSTSRRRAAVAIEKFKAGGIQVATLPDGPVEAIRRKWGEVAEKRAVFDPHFQAIFQSLYGAR